MALGLQNFRTGRLTPQSRRHGREQETIEEGVFAGQICEDMLQQGSFCNCVSLETCLISVSSSSAYISFLTLH